jgi:hypothetical protein
MRAVIVAIVLAVAVSTNAAAQFDLPPMERNRPRPPVPAQKPPAPISRPSTTTSSVSKPKPLPAPARKASPAVSSPARSTVSTTRTDRVATQGQRDRAALQQFPEVGRTVRGVSPIIDRAARQHAERSAQNTTGNKAIVTSRDRPASARLHSEAHDRGAVDVVTPKMSTTAKPLSRNVGAGYTVIHERPARPAPGAPGPSADIHTSYQNGRAVRSSAQAPRATGEHIHVQPDFNSRLHQAAKPQQGLPTSAVTQSRTAPARSSPTTAPAPRASTPAPISQTRVTPTPRATQSAPAPRASTPAPISQTRVTPTPRATQSAPPPAARNEPVRSQPPKK